MQTQTQTAKHATKPVSFGRIAMTFDDRLESAQREIAEFAAKVVSDPAYAFKWSGGAVDAAAEVAVYTQIVSWTTGASERAQAGDETITAVALLETIVQTATERVVHFATYPPQSTSPLSNLVEISTGKAWAEVLKIASRLQGKSIL